MCCRTRVYPLHIETAIAILTIGRFTPVHWQSDDPRIAITWERLCPGEETKVIASLSSDALEISLSPAISSFADHFGKRIAGGVYFEIAAKYAEKVGGEVIQRATVTGCRRGNDSQELLLAKYPRMPLEFTRVCVGFQAVILGDAAA